MLNDAFSDEISEENESDFDVKTDLDYALDCFCDIFNIDIDKSLITDRDNGNNPIDTTEKAEKAMTEDESEPEKLTGDMFEAEGPDGTRHIFKASSFSAGTIIDPPGCNTFYHVHRPYNPDEPFCVWVDPLNNYYTNIDIPIKLPRGETGRRAWLKIKCPQGRVGSTPTEGTTQRLDNAGWLGKG